MIASTHSVHPLAPEFRSEDGTKPIAPVAHRFVADLDTPLMQEILHVAQRQREPNLEHHRQADDLWARLEVTERGALGHAVRLAGCPDRLK